MVISWWTAVQLGVFYLNLPRGQKDQILRLCKMVQLNCLMLWIPFHCFSFHASLVPPWKGLSFLHHGESLILWEQVILLPVLHPPTVVPVGPFSMSHFYTDGHTSIEFPRFFWCVWLSPHAAESQPWINSRVSSCFINMNEHWSTILSQITALSWDLKNTEERRGVHARFHIFIK